MNRLDRYSPRNEDFVLVRSQKPEARSRNLNIQLFWLLASGFRWRDLKGEALGWYVGEPAGPLIS